ncbi:MAG: DNA polymerase III subunit beta [Candidatus Vogelbacteria bacterium]|nr:DNA polymerase III subunit beta [Candidatus Vogelbacteria bacterium]
MKAECAKDKLKEAVSQVGKIAAKNLSLPILESILFEARDKNIILRATNLDVGLEIKIPAKVEKNGVIALPSDILNAFLSGLSDSQTIKLELINNNLLISTLRNSTVIKSFPVDDFPTIPQIDKEESFSLEANKVVLGIKSVVYATSLSDMKPEIASVFIYSDNDELVFVSTDSFRLAEKQITRQQKDKKMSIILPFKNAMEIARIFEQSKDILDIYFNKNQISIVSPSVYFTSRIVGGIFPDYRQIIPKEKKTEVVVLKKDLADSIKVSNIFSDKFNQINIKVIPEDSLFEISSRNQDRGESSTRVPATVEGEAVDINLNARYILDCLPSISEDSIHIILNGSNKPVIIKGVGDASFLYLVMPMNN